MGKLTDRQIANAKPEGKDSYFNDGGGLYLRLRTSGSKSWFYRYKVDNKPKMLSIGVYPSITLSQARAEALRLKMLRDLGNDPAAELLHAEEIKRFATDALQSEAARLNARLTISELLKRWERTDLLNRKDKGAEIRRSFEKDVLPKIGNIAVEDVKRGLIAEILDTVVERGSPIIARNLLSTMRQMFLFAIKREYIEIDPTVTLKRDDYGKRVERSRVFNDAEIKELKAKIPAANLQNSTVLAIWLMLSTCCRVGEISRARWADIDFIAKTWRISSDNSKNGKEHTVLLSQYSLNLFRQLKKINGHSTWCFPAENKEDAHVDLKSISKQIHDRQRITPLKNRSNATGVLILKGGTWTPHDLRRTGATMMGRLNIRPDVIEKCLNHIQQNKLIRIYQRQELITEQWDAWQRLGKHLKKLVLEN